MAAVDAFESFLAALSHEDKEKLKGFIAEQREQLLAARSEDARVRIVHEFITEANHLLKKK